MRSTLTSVCVLFLLAGCGAERPATVRAVAVGIGALGTGAATSAAACVRLGDEACRDVALTSSIVVLGAALAAAAVAFLGHPASGAALMVPRAVAPIEEPLPAPEVKPAEPTP